jgi:uncharacterized tellurite resistance protein B-like protein
MLKSLQSFFGSMAQNDTKQSEREASIDLMIMTMFIDKSLKLAEDEILNEYVKNLSWESPLSVDKYFGVATAKVRSALGNAEKMDALLADIKSRIVSEQTKQQILKACQDLAIADKDLSNEEQDFLDRVAKILL